MWTLYEAKNKFSAVVDAALKGMPQKISRRGKPAVVVISSAEYDKLCENMTNQTGSLIDHLLAFPDDNLSNEALSGTKIVLRDVEF